MKTRLHSSCILLAALAIGAAGLTTGCREQKAPAPMPTNAVAMVGGQVITREAFANELSRRAGRSPGQSGDPKEKQALLEELIRFEVLHQKALAAGYDRDPQITANLKRMIVTKYQEDQLAKLGSPKITREEIVHYYNTNPERFGTPEKIRAALIEIKVARTAPAEKRAEAAAGAEAVRAEALTNAASDRTFGLVAQRYSEHQSSRYQGGDIGWLTAGLTNSEWPAAVLAALFKLSQPGEISPVIATPAGFYLVKLVERQPAKVRPLQEVQDGIAYLTAREQAQQRQEEFLAALKQGIDIRINQALLDSLSVPTQETKPPGVPGGTTALIASPAGK